MTDNEARIIIEGYLGDDETINEAIEIAGKALEEIQPYRELRTAEEVKCAMKYLSLAKKHGTIGQVIDSCAEYESLGTVEELREAMEKQKPKKPNIWGD